MKMSDECRHQVTEPSEGLRLTAYRDCVGIWTIGYGHTSKAGKPRVFPGQIISNKEADAILAADLNTFETGVSSMLADIKGVKQYEFDALVDLAFNIGLGAFRSSSLLRAYRFGNKAVAADKFMDWVRGGGKVLPGLVTRRKKDRAWFVDGRLGARTTTMFLDIEEEMAHKLNHPDPWMDRLDNWLSIGG